MGRVLITGSSGQIGANLGARLSNRGFEVTGLDKRSNSWVDSFSTKLSDLSTSDIDWPIEPVDVIVHLAANARVHDSVAHPELAYENYMVSLNVLRFAAQTRTPVILASSREIYGQQFCEEVAESAGKCCSPCSPYGVMKRAVELLGRQTSLIYSFPIISLRFSNVFGRFDSDLSRMTRVIPLFISNLISSKRIEVYGRNKTLDFTHIDDCINGIERAIHRLLSGDKVTGEINVSSGRAYTLEMLTDELRRITGCDTRIVFRQSREGEVERYRANITKAHAVLGYQPQYDLVSGLEFAWSDYYAKVFLKSDQETDAGKAG